MRKARAVGHPNVFLIDPPNTVEHCDALIRSLAQQARVLCVELPGFGFSTPGPAFDFGIEAYTLTIDELLRAGPESRLPLCARFAVPSLASGRLARARQRAAVGTSDLGHLGKP